MNLLSLLKSVGGEKSLGGTVGRWMQAVSRFLDGLGPKYVIAYRAGAAQAIPDLSVTTTLLLDTVSADGGVPYDPATGAFSLEANSLYELSFHALFRNFGTEATDYAAVAWQDVAGNVLVSGCVAFCVPPASTLNIAPQPVARLLVETTGALQVHAVATGGSGSGDMGRSYAIVRKLGSVA